jgi:hypothetical protein
MTAGSKKEEWKNNSLPYLFVLKEGPEFEKNLLDYSLCIMQIRPETFAAPSSKIVITARNKYDTKLGTN